MVDVKFSDGIHPDYLRIDYIEQFSCIYEIYTKQFGQNIVHGEKKYSRRHKLMKVLQKNIKNYSLIKLQILRDLFKCEFRVSDDDLSITYATQEDLNKYKWPENIKSICISRSWIDHIDIPNGVETFTCSKSLRTITIPDSLKYLYLEDTTIYSLDLPIDIKRVWVPNNYIRHITFRGTNKPTHLEVLNLESNLLESLDIQPPSTLYEMDLRKNYIPMENINPSLLIYARTHEDCIVDF